MKNIFRYLLLCKREAILAPLFKLIEAVLELITPLILAYLIDQGIGDKNRDIIISYGILMIGLSVLGFILSCIAQRWSAVAASKVSKNLRESLYNKLKRLSLEGIESYDTSRVYALINNDCLQVQNGINLLLRLVLRSPFIVILSIIATMEINLKLSMLFIITIILLTGIILLVQLISIKGYHKLQESIEVIMKKTKDIYKGLKIIKAFNKSEYHYSELRELINENRDIRLFLGRVEAFLNPVTFFIVNIATLLILEIGYKDYNISIITKGEVFALVNYMSKILLELIKTVIFSMNLNRAIAASNRIEEFLNNNSLDIKLQDNNVKKGCSHTEKIDSFINIKNLYYSFSNQADNVLENITFNVEKGEKIGIIGRVGSGKTVLVDIFLGRYKVKRNTIIINGKDINDYNEEELSNIITLVPQREYIVEDTLRNNIDPTLKYSDYDIKIAMDNSDISELYKEYGLEYELKLDGDNLSRGQRQRIGIARGICNCNKLLIVDDALTAIDDKTQDKIFDKLIYKSDTMIFLTNRARLLSKLNRIIFIDNGRLIDIGSHDELYGKYDMYRKML